MTKSVLPTLTDEELEANATRFVGLLESIQTEGANIQGLVEYLQGTDFFVAPASTKFHGSYRGGLVAHSLLVYDNLRKLIDAIQDEGHEPIPEDSVKVVALLHDLSKANYYEPSFKNEKVYNPDGKKFDEGGKFDWVATGGYKVKPEASRFICVNHDVNSAYLVSCYYPLSVEEFAAISSHSGLMSDSVASNPDINEIYRRYPLALLLHQADALAAYYQQI